MAVVLSRRATALKRDQDSVNFAEIVREVEKAFRGEAEAVKITHRVVGPIERLRYLLDGMAEIAVDVDVGQWRRPD